MKRKNTRLSLLFILPMLLALGSCDSKGDVSTSSAPSSVSSSTPASSSSTESSVEPSEESSTLAPVVTIAIKAPEKTTLTVGETLQLEVEVENADEKDVSFLSSDPAVLSVSPAGLVTALKAGTASVTAKIGDVESAPVSFTVQNKAIVVEIEAPEKTDLTLGETLQLASKVENNVDGLPLVYSSDDETVLTVSETGLVTAVGVGTATITLTVGTVSDSVEFTVGRPAATGIEIQVPATMYVGQSVEVGAVITPEDADQDYDVFVSDEIKMAVDGHKITAMQETAEGEKLTVSVKTKDGLLSDSAEIAIVPQAQYALETVTAIIAKSNALEVGGALLSASYETESKSEYYTDTSSGEATFYSDDTAVFTEYGSYSDYIYTRKIVDNKLYTIQQVVEDDGTKTINNVETEDIVESDPVYGESTLEDAKKQVNLPEFDYDFGFSTFFMTLMGENYFGSESAKDVTLSQEGNTTTLSADIASYYSYYKDKLTLTVDDTGLITAATYVRETWDVDYDTEQPTEVTRTETSTFAQTAGTRKSSEEDDVLSLADLEYQSFDVYFSTSSYNGGPIPEGTDMEIGKSYFLYIDNPSPATATSDYDQVKITSVTPSEGVTISEGSTYSDYFASVSFAKAGTYTLTLESVNVTKQVTCTVVEPQLKGIAFGSRNTNALFLPSMIQAGKDYTLEISPNPTNAAMDLVWEFPENSAGASATPVEGESNQFTIRAEKEGSFTLLVYDKTLGKDTALTKTVTVFPDTDAGLVDLFDQATFSASDSSNSIDFVKTDESGGTFTFESEGNWESITAEGKWTVKDGAISLTDLAFDPDDYVPGSGTKVYDNLSVVLIQYAGEYDDYSSYAYFFMD